MGNGNSAQEQINTEAIVLAAKAMERIERHEEHCVRADTERRADFRNLESKIDGYHGDVSKKIGNVHGRVDALLGRWFTAACTLIIGLLSIIGYLMINGAPWMSGG